MARSFTLVCAMDLNRAIGVGGDLPWRLPSDMRRFRRLTVEHAVVMGRRTFQSIGQPLRRRRNLVLSRSGFRAEGVEVCPGLDALPEDLDGEIMIIGGAAVYAAALPRADRLCLSVVRAEIEGADTWFPDFDASGWEVRSREVAPADERHAYEHVYYDLARSEVGSGLSVPPTPFPRGVGLRAEG